MKLFNRKRRVEVVVYPEDFTDTWAGRVTLSNYSVPFSSHTLVPNETDSLTRNSINNKKEAIRVGLQTAEKQIRILSNAFDTEYAKPKIKVFDTASAYYADLFVKNYLKG